jgi:DnaJ-class molecular chaperone
MFQFQFQDDYYQILNVKPKCTKKEITQAYRKQALKWHPDKNKTENAHHMFVKIAEAYEVLSDTVKRNTYDAYYFSEESRSQDANFTKTHKNPPENAKNASSGWGFKNPFEIFHNLFPNIDSKLLNVFSKAVSHMKTVTNHDFLIKLIDEYRYFAKNKNYKYDMEATNTEEKDDVEYKKTKHKYDTNSNSTDMPPKQMYVLEISLADYLQTNIKRIHLPMLAKCVTCSIKRRDGCRICNGHLYYESTKIYPVPVNDREVYFQEGGNFLPDYKRPCDLIIYCKDKFNKFYRRIGGYHLYTYVYWDGCDAIFRYIDDTFYKLNVYNQIYKNNKNDKNEPCDFANNVMRINNMGLPDYEKNINRRGDLFIRFTQDEEYTLSEDNTKKAVEYLKYHPENEIDPSEILRIDDILEHFT